MLKDLSIVLVDKRHYRIIAQENWGLTDAQMKGMHVHHRINRSKGGTNDPSNLYVCSPYFHKHIWHDGLEWISYAVTGGVVGAEARRKLWQTDEEWASKMREAQRVKAQKSHSVRGEEYSSRQRRKALRAVCSKRKWDKLTYELVSLHYFSGVTTGYLVAKKLGVSKWRPISNMLDCISLGLTFEQATNTDLYLKELDRLNDSPVSHLLKEYK
jgi:hypothetical protein